MRWLAVPAARVPYPEQWRLVRRGVRIWVQVAIRSCTGKREAWSLPEAVEDGGGAKDEWSLLPTPSYDHR